MKMMIEVYSVVAGIDRVIAREWLRMIIRKILRGWYVQGISLDDGSWYSGTDLMQG